jgi:uncharacterized protein YoxC
MFLDLSHNGSIADEAAMLTAVVGLVGLLVSIYRAMRRTAVRVANIDSTLNHVGEPVGLEGPTIGQRVKAIDDRVNGLDRKLDRLTSKVDDLAGAMLDHINEEARRIQRLDEKVQQLDRRRDWNPDA